MSKEFPLTADEYAQLGGRRAVAVPFSEIERERVEWLWEQRIAKGAANLLVGDPGLGKSLLTCALATRLSRGELTGTPGVTLMATAEDHHAAVVRPRLEVAGADLRYVQAFQMRSGDFEESFWLPDDVAELDRLVGERLAELVVVDPLMAHLAESVDSYRDQAVRLALAPLHQLAERHGCAVVVVAHLNKVKSSSPVHRVGGSVGLYAAARSVLLLARDPDDPGGETGSQRVLAQTKSNYGELAASLIYEIEAVPVPDDPVTRVARIAEIGESGLSGEALLAGGTHAPRLEEATEFLRDQLSAGRVPSEEVKAAADAAGVSEKTLRKARERLGVVAKREASGHTTWRLREPRAPGEGAEGVRGTKGHEGAGSPSAVAPGPLMTPPALVPYRGAKGARSIPFLLSPEEVVRINGDAAEAVLTDPDIERLLAEHFSGYDVPNAEREMLARNVLRATAMANGNRTVDAHEGGAA